ncbi:MAG: hypothetical protein ACOYXA_19455 [Bacteroidota bacterium]
MRRLLFLIAITIVILARSADAQTSDTLPKQNPLDDDVYLHPVDCVTPYTLKKGEWIYAQSIQTLPFPSWAFYGITDKLTAQLDLLPWLYGVFTELKKPIPSINLRYRFNTQKGLIPTVGVETMFVHFWDTLQRFKTPSVTVWENGSYFHFKPSISYQIKEVFFVNLSLGVDYIHELILQNNEPNNFQTKAIGKSWNPNYAIGVDYRPSKWISYHAAYNYGSTLSFLENVPRKIQLTYGFRVAPFFKNKHGVLRNLRIECVAINGYFPDVDAKQTFPLPIFPYFYWQWKKG